MRYTGNYKEDYPHCLKEMQDALERIKKESPSKFGNFIIKNKLTQIKAKGECSLKITPYSDVNACVRKLRNGRFQIEVNYGCFKALDKDSLQALLSHELVHIIQDHFHTKMLSTLVPTFVILCGAVLLGLATNKPVLILYLAFLPLTLFFFLYSKVVRKQEEEADTIGVNGSSVESMIQLMETINKQSPTKDSYLGRFKSLFGSHPFIHARIAYLNKNKNRKQKVDYDSF